MWEEPTVVYTPTMEEEIYNNLQVELQNCIRTENYERCSEIVEEMKKFPYFINI